MLKFINLVKLTSTGLLGILMASALASKPASANNALTVTIEAPRIQTAQSKTAAYTVDFNDKSGTESFTKTNGSNTYSYGSNLIVKTQDQWGGANGTRYITQSKDVSSFNVKVNQDQRYFGFWWSAGDSANKIIFKNDGEEVAVFQTKDLVGFINSRPAAEKTLYYGNPNCPTVGVAPCGSNTGHKAEPFAYVNVYFNNEIYDEIVIQTLSGSKFESDNHTFSAQNQTVTGVNVPQLASAANDLVSTSEDNGTAGNVMTNDLGVNLSVTKINGDATKIAQQVTLTSGALVTLNSNGTFTYNPHSKFESLNPNQTATDTFSYTIKDNQNNVSTATVTMTIEGAADNPVAVDDTSNTDEDTIKWIYVLMNDSDPNTAKQNLSITKIGNTVVNGNTVIRLNSGATVQVWENSDSSKHSTQGKYTLKYDPNPSSSLNALNKGNTGTDTFTYNVSDPQGNSGQGSVTVTVDGITDTSD
jgi:VCBS repeat-containing protein